MIAHQRATRRGGATALSRDGDEKLFFIGHPCVHSWSTVRGKLFSDDGCWREMTKKKKVKTNSRKAF
ncbi:Phosphoglucosamine mutase [Sesbania bispinosa]|nr:Phosphoglucosamine mutase [Sesbania bispinosa]